MFLMMLMVSASISMLSANEPLCSKFPYEEQLLEKMIRMEVKVEQMAAEMRRTQSEVQETLVKQDAKLAEMAKQSATQDEDIKKLKARLISSFIGFSAYYPASNSLRTGEILLLQKTTFNTGGGYEPLTGVFTAPETGLYQFSVHVCNIIGRYVHYAIVQQDHQIALSEQRDEDVNTCSSASALAIVDKGQKVFVRCTAGYDSGDQIMEDLYRRTTFQGVLLHKTS